MSEQLKNAGMSEAAAAAKSALFSRAEVALRKLGADVNQQTLAYFVPGRIEVLGKHTDYAGGRSLLCALERGFCLMAVPRKDSIIRLLDVGGDLSVEFHFDPELEVASGEWTAYPKIVARRIARNFPGAERGADIAFASDLPPAAGLASSSAFIVSVFLALSEINRLHARREYFVNICNDTELAGYLACIENGQNFGLLAGDCGVGTQGGSEDHTAILCCQPGELSLCSFLPVRCERTVALPDEFQFALAVSGIAAEKTGAAAEAYNRASRAARAVLDLWNAATKRSDISLAAAIASSPASREKMRGILLGSAHPDFSANMLWNRFEHVFGESATIIPGVVNALERRDWPQVGAQVAQSQVNAEYLLGNQIPETIALAHAARELGAVAASSFGAGFGGSVWALVRTQETDAFLSRWEARYRDEFPSAAQRAQFFASRPGPAAMRLDLS